jgi:excinuclease UvrABC ATPase subunit
MSSQQTGRPAADSHDLIQVRGARENNLADVDQLLQLLDRLVDDGNTVIVIEHHQAVMAHADWLVDLGPGAGHDGGQVVFTGTPADLVAHGDSLTARHLRAYLQGG